MMKIAVRFVLLLVVLVGSVAIGAQTGSADEKAIRDLVAAEDAGTESPVTSNSIFWSGAYKRPAVRGESKGEPMPGLADRVGSPRSKTTIRRIEVSQSGDMAYEFSDRELTVQRKMPDGKVESTTFPTSVLRVWKKVNGQWHGAAQFARPHEQ